MKFDILIVQPGRHGDILACLPIAWQLAQAGCSVAWAVGPEFLPTLQGASYVTPILWKGFFMDGERAVKELGHVANTVLNLRVEGGKPHMPQANTFIEEMWERAGVLDRWDELPLVLDNRDPQREARLVQKVGGRDTLLLALDGHSSPLPIPIQDHVRRWAEGWEGDVVDLGTVQAERLYDMCGLLQAAKLLVAIDSAILHLSYATRTPTIGLQSITSSWHATRPRKHWLTAIPYDQITDVLV